MQIFTPISTRYLSPGKKYIFLLKGSPLELPSHVIHFLGSSRQADLSSNRHVTLRLTVFEIFVFLDGRNFGFGGSLEGTAPPKGEKTYPGPICTLCKISRRSVLPPRLAVWLSWYNALVSINVVALRQTRLVPR